MTNTCKKFNDISAKEFFQHNSFHSEKIQIISKRIKENYRTQVEAVQQFNNSFSRGEKSDF